MTVDLIALIIMGFYLLAGLAMLFLGGQLVRHDLNRAAAKLRKAGWPPSRIIEDLRPVQDIVVEFFARSEQSSRLLGVLDQHKRPLSVNTILEEVQLQTNLRKNSNPPSLQLAWAALFIMRLAGLVRFSRRGVVLGDAGREVQRRIAGDSVASPQNKVSTMVLPRAVSDQSVTTTARKAAHNGSGVRSRAHIGREALQRRQTLPSVHQSCGPAPRNIGEQLKRRLVKSFQNLSESKLITEKNGPTRMKKRPIIMTAADHAELSFAIAAIDKLTERGRGEMKALQSELARASIATPENLPPDVITMNSSAELLDLDTKERMEFTLVFPRDADLEEGRISVLAPLGTAMLGYRVGDEFEWIVPYGLRRLKVTAVRFQPEAALALAA